MNLKDSKNSAIFSLRIVSVDNYMKTPLFGLDTCYSDFRADEVKQVPIIRVFGCDSNGNKTCAHIHGVFPYLYVPYAGGDSAGESDRLAYQLASSLDKAINISLGQANSTAQHVFKIVLVKAKPFYGYHQSVHKFLKIFLYNPSFVKRAANLLQNGAILGRVYQPHESHVPFILQFMIDYNLYGMSFIHVPAKLVRYRQQKHDPASEFSISGDDIEIEDSTLAHIDPGQILDRKIERMSTSKQEIDLNAAVILNRFQISMTDEESEHANPGIAFLWSDERGRRSKMDGTPPPLVTTQEPTQDRGSLMPTESELFHLAALNRRLEQIRAESPSTQSSDSFHTLLDQTLNRTNAANRKFNLNQFLHNSVYPAEWTATQSNETSEQSICDASFLIDHLGARKVMSNHNASETSCNRSQQRWDSVQFDPNDTFVDEELILNLTQRTSNTTLLNETLNENEHEVLDIFELLEEDDEPNHDETLRIDDDSVLAPLSQRQKETTHFSQNKNNTDQMASFEDEDSDDDLLNEFSMSMLDCMPADKNEFDLKIPQMDGALPDSPKSKSSFKKGALKPNMRSPSKSANKYAPLPIFIGKSPTVQQLEAQSIARHNGIPLKVPRLCLEKCDASPLLKTYDISKVPPKSISQPKMPLKPGSKLRLVKSSTNCQSDRNATEKLEKSNENDPCSPKTEVPEEYKDLLKKQLVVKLIKYNNIEEALLESTNNSKMSYRDNDENMCATKRQRSDSDLDILESTPEPEEEPVRRYPKRDRKPRQILMGPNVRPSATRRAKNKQVDEEEFNSIDALYSWYNWSDCKLAEQYDRERDFFPEPGPSNLNYYENEDLPGYHRPILKTKAPKTPTKTPIKTPAKLSSHKPSAHKPSNTTTQKHSIRKTKANILNGSKENSPVANRDSQASSENSDWENDIHVQSFYEQSFVQHLPSDERKTPDALESPISNGLACNRQSVNKTSNNKSNESVESSTETEENTTIVSTPVLSKVVQGLMSEFDGVTTRGKRYHDRFKIRPSEIAPDHRDVHKLLNSHEYPKVIHPIPYYSDPNDIVAENAKKEVGHTVLQLAGNAVNDCEEFKSQLDVVGMSKWQGVIAKTTIRSSDRIRDNKELNDECSVRKRLARKRGVRITPKEVPPPQIFVQNWLDIRSKSNQPRRLITRRMTTNGHHGNAQNPEEDQHNNQISTTKHSDDNNDLNGNTIEENVTVTPNCLNNNNKLIQGLLANKELTIRITKTSKNLQSNGVDPHGPIDISSDDDDSDDVILVTDVQPTKTRNIGKVVRCKRKCIELQL